MKWSGSGSEVGMTQNEIKMTFEYECILWWMNFGKNSHSNQSKDSKDYVRSFN